MLPVQYQLSSYPDMPFLKWFHKYLFPGLFGLAIYLVVRILNETMDETAYDDCGWKFLEIEIFTSMLVGYLVKFVLDKLFKRFDKHLLEPISYKIILREMLQVALAVAFIMNSTIIPFLTFTENGLSLGDAVVSNVIPILFTQIYYAVLRSNKLLKAYVNNKMQLEKMTNSQLQTELKFLKAQYHPHFLFNALNTIYFQMDEDVIAAKVSVEKFSSLLRYQLYDQQQTVPVSQEIEYLRNFIDLQKIRTSEKLKLNVHFDEQLNQQQIYPLLLLPLVENAFKYAGDAFVISIDARLKNNIFHFEVRNSIPAYISSKLQSGIGLENLRRRLELLYPGKSQLLTSTNSDQYVALLSIELTNPVSEKLMAPHE